MGQRVLLVCLVINCLAGAQAQQSDSTVCCQRNSEAIAGLTAAVNRATNICDPTVRVPQDCSDIDKARTRASGVYQIYIPNNSIGPRLAYCDLSNPGQNWLVLQRRKDGSENFERTWREYANGFGNLNGEFWIGNEALYVLTNSFRYRLRFDLEDFQGQRRYAEYSYFRVASSADNYRLSVSGYSGNAGDSFSVQNSLQFSTKDADHDTWSTGSCAQTFRGAWWYHSCHWSNLNGLYLRGEHSSYADGIEWNTFRGLNYSLKFTEMKITRL